MNQEQREIVRERLRSIEKSLGGRLTASAVVEDASDPGSPLHSLFEWNNKKAAHAYRLEQARSLITSVMVVVHTETKTVQSVYYVRDPSAETNQQGYVSIDRLRSEQDLAREAIVNEFSRARAVLNRARSLAEVLSIEAEVDDLIVRVDSIHKAVAHQLAG